MILFIPSCNGKCGLTSFYVVTGIFGGFVCIIIIVWLIKSKCSIRKDIYEFFYDNFACCCKNKKKEIQQHQLNERIIYTAQIKNISIEDASILNISELQPYELIPIRCSEQQNKLHDEMLEKLLNVKNRDNIR